MRGHASSEVFDWHFIFFGQEHWSFLPQVVLKTVMMFIVVVISLRVIGRRGIMQRVFQVVTIIMLGSAAGDPMLYKEVCVVPAALIFALIVVLYRIGEYFLAKFSVLETYAEGRQICIIEEGGFAIGNFKKKELSKDEIFADLRFEGVTQIGQVASAFMEAKGEISVFFHRNEKVKYGFQFCHKLVNTS